MRHAPAAGVTYWCLPSSSPVLPARRRHSGPRANCKWSGVGAVVPAHLYAERLVAGPRLNLVQHGKLAGCGVRRGLHVRVGDADGALQRGELVEVRGK